MQSLGLLRKYQGRLQQTRLGVSAGASDERLWNVLADRIVPKREGFESDAARLLLLSAASSVGAEIPFDTVAAALGHLGWRTGDREPVAARDLFQLPTLGALREASGRPGDWPDPWRISPVAAALARAALIKR